MRGKGEGRVREKKKDRKRWYKDIYLRRKTDYFFKNSITEMVSEQSWKDRDWRKGGKWFLSSPPAELGS